jgi:hypothetical protein
VREQELAAGRSRGGSGDGGATWRGRSRPTRGREAASRVLGWHVARLRAAGSGPSRNRGGEGMEVDEGDLFAISRKCRDSSVKPK